MSHIPRCKKCSRVYHHDLMIQLNSYCNICHGCWYTDVLSITSDWRFLLHEQCLLHRSECLDPSSIVHIGWLIRREFPCAPRYLHMNIVISINPSYFIHIASSVAFVIEWFVNLKWRKLDQHGKGRETA